MSIHAKKLSNRRTAYRVKMRDPSGQQYSRTFRTRRDAERFELEQRSAHLTGGWVDPRAGKLPLADYAGRWLGERAALRPRTAELYEYLLRRHLLPDLGAIDLADLTPARVRAWHAALSGKASIGPSTVAKCYRLLKTILTTAVEDEMITRNPCVLKGVSAERPDERPVADVAQIAALADAIDPRYRAMVLMATWCGLRFGELAGLARRDVDLTAGTVRVRRQLQELADGSQRFGPPKTEAGKRTVAIPPHVLVEIRRHLAAHVGAAADALVFSAPDGDLLRRSNFTRRIWAPACQAVGLEGFRFHDTRHTGNTLAASTGASTRELMARMGHASPRAALIYQHATAERDHALAAALTRLADQQKGPETAPRTPPDPPGCSPNVPSRPQNRRTRSGFRRESPGQDGGLEVA